MVGLIPATGAIVDTGGADSELLAVVSAGTDAAAKHLRTSSVPAVAATCRKSATSRRSVSRSLFAVRAISTSSQLCSRRETGTH